MSAGIVYALLPPLLALLFRYLSDVLALGWEGISPPLSALLRSLPALALFWGWPREAFARPYVLPFYGAYAGAVLDEAGFYGALTGFLLGLLLLPLLRVPRRYRFWAAVFFVALSAGVFTAVWILLGAKTGWILPLVVVLSGFLDPAPSR